MIGRAGVALPHVCYHPQLGPIQTCDTCLVEVDGELVRACATPVSQDMSVRTATERAQSARTEAFDRILSNHLLYCTVCDNNNGNCAVHNTTKMLAIEHQSLPFKTKPYEVDNTNPFYRYDPDQCILCGRCVEACQNLEVNETLSIRWEDPHPRVLWDGGAPIGESSCVSCGHCVTVCPCNALMEKSMLHHAGFMTGLSKPAIDGMIDIVKGLERETGYAAILKVSEVESKMRETRIRRTKTVCTYCGVGCSFDIWTKDRHILKVEPAEGPANGVSTCIKGKFAWDFVNSQDRLTTPLIREGDRFREAGWDEALDLVATRLAEIKAKNGADALGFIASSKCTNEESYLMQKLARAVIGTNNVDNCSRYCQAPATAGLFRTVGYGGDSGSIADIEQADLVMIVGSNTAESHPVLATRVKRAHKLHGQKLIVSDLREHEMARRADVFLHPRPGTDLVWLSAVSRYLLDNGLAHTAFLDQWVNNLEEYRKSLEPFTLEFASRTCGLPVETLKQVAHMIADAGACLHPVGDGRDAAQQRLRYLHGDLEPVAGDRQLYAAGHRRLPAARAQQRPGRKRPRIHAELPARLSIGGRSGSAAQVRERLERPAAVHQGSGQSRDGGRHSPRQAEGDVPVRRRDEHRRFECQLCQRRFQQTRILRGAGYLFSATCKFADVVLPACPSLEKGGHLHQHGKAHPAAVPGFRTDGRQPAGLADRAADRESARRRLELPASFRSHGRNRVSYADVRRCELSAPGRIQEPAVAGRRRWRR